jgi:VWFA-related protein
MRSCLLLCLALLIVGSQAIAQPKQKVRTVTIPISIFTKKEIKERRAEEFVQVETITLREDKEDQQILSIRSVADTPLSIAILIQEDLASSFNNQLKEIRTFIQGLPKGTRVMTAYLRAGAPQITQRFTDDLDLASRSLRIVSGSSTIGPRSPYAGVSDILSRFDATPAGRRAILLFSDGLDSSSGLNLASITQSADLDRAALAAQRRSVAVYSLYWPTQITENGNTILAAGAQGALQKLADQTGGRSFGSGLITPVDLTPYFKDLNLTLGRQFALSYLSTHMKKGYHSIQVTSTNPDVKIGHPSGYYYR